MTQECVKIRWLDQSPRTKASAVGHLNQELKLPVLHAEYRPIEGWLIPLQSNLYKSPGMSALPIGMLE
jgi:hypothetical protein